MEESLWHDAIRSVFAMIDRMVYSLISIFYNTIVDLANVQILKTSEVAELTGRIYALIGVFMIFKVSFSLITYLVDPDKIMDKSQGTGTLIKNIVITFVLIISVPFAFDLLYEAQSAILSDQIIPKFIFGNAIESSNADVSGGGYTITMHGCENIVNVDNMGDYIGLAIYKPFFVPEQDLDSTKGLPSNMSSWYCTAGCAEDYDCQPSNRPSVKNLMSKSDLYNAPKKNVDKYKYDMDYTFLISTAVGVVVALLFLSFCFDIAVRLLKLLFLEIIAPIPIMSYIDPNSAKNGTFSKWLKEVSGTWVSLFTRLASVFLAVFVIQKISSNGNLYFSNGYNYDGKLEWLKVLIIIGALIFAKQLPKMMEDVLGFKLGGNMTLNPFKKLESEALGGKQISTGIKGTGMAVATGVAGAAGGATANLINNYKKFKENPSENPMKFKDTITSMGSGLLYGGYHGIRTGYGAGKGGKYNVIGEGLKATQKASEDRNLNEALIKQGASKAPFAKGRFMIKDKFTDIIGYQGKTGTTDELKGQLKQMAAQKQLIQSKFTNAQESISRYNANASNLFKESINKFNQFEHKYKTDANGNMLLNGDGSVQWEDNLQSYNDFMKIHGGDAMFSSMSRADEEKFELEYNSMLKASQDYRKSYDDLLVLNKAESKLTGDKEKFDAAKKGAKS